MHALGGAERREGGGVAVRIQPHQALDLGAKRVRDLDLRRVGDGRGIGLEVDALVPAGRERRGADRSLVANVLHFVGH